MLTTHDLYLMTTAELRVTHDKDVEGLANRFGVTEDGALQVKACCELLLRLKRAIYGGKTKEVDLLKRALEDLRLKPWKCGSPLRPEERFPKP